MHRAPTTNDAGLVAGFDRLRGAGVLVRERHSDQNAGQVTGYSVAVPGFRNRGGEPVWYGGGKLRPPGTED